MVNAKGEAYDIPEDKIADAKKSGLEMTTALVDDKGQIYDVPSSKLGEAWQTGKFKIHAPERNIPKMGAGEAAVRGFADAGTFGAAPAIAGTVEAASQGKSPWSPEAATARAGENLDYQRASEDQPTANIAGNAAAIVPTVIGPGGIAQVARGAGGAVKGLVASVKPALREGVEEGIDWFGGSAVKTIGNLFRGNDAGVTSTRRLSRSAVATAAHTIAPGTGGAVVGGTMGTAKALEILGKGAIAGVKSATRGSTADISAAGVATRGAAWAGLMDQFKSKPPVEGEPTPESRIFIQNQTDPEFRKKMRDESE